MLTAMALLAFAGNSILCRLALNSGAIDAGSFTLLRLLSGICILILLLRVPFLRIRRSGRGSWWSAAFLFVYALAFSYAYMSLDTGVGALILFAAVQITMVLWGMVKGYRLSLLEWVGLAFAFSGFVYLVSPTLSTPSAMGFGLMVLSGIAWGFYTLAGRSSTSPLADTAYNFLRTLPYVLVAVCIGVVAAYFDWLHIHWSTTGVILAVLSGALASGVGYAIWYMALVGLSSTQAAVVQLLVPVIASIGGVIFSNEILGWRLVISTLLVLGGILLVVLGRSVLVLPTSVKR